MNTGPLPRRVVYLRRTAGPGVPHAPRRAPEPSSPPAARLAAVRAAEAAPSQAAFSEALHTWWHSLSPAQQEAQVQRLSTSLATDNFWVLRNDGSKKAIPAVLTPTVVGNDELRQLYADTRVLFGALKKAARHLVDVPTPLAERILAPFSPLERRSFQVDPSAFERVASGRIDFLKDTRTGQYRVLEMNTTLPCIQGFSDSLTRHWLPLVTQGAPDLMNGATANRSALGLLSGLMESYRHFGGAADKPSILLVSRRGDTEMGELQYLARTFNEQGHSSRYVFADEVGATPDGWLEAGGKNYDLLYRHIFARLLPEDSPIPQHLLQPGNTKIFNPITSPLELKALIALLSEATANPTLARTLGLTPAELKTLARVTPWTRLVREGPLTLPDGTTAADARRWLSSHRDELVLKRGWSHGGQSVHVGVETQDWPRRVAEALAEPDEWTVQQYVKPERMDRLVMKPGEDGKQRVGLESLIADLGVYFTVTDRLHPTGQLSRGSPTAVVNIGAGGGVSTVLTPKATP